MCKTALPNFMLVMYADLTRAGLSTKPKHYPGFRPVGQHADDLFGTMGAGLRIAGSSTFIPFLFHEPE